MRIVMMKKKKESCKRDMFAVLSVIQSAITVMIVFVLFAFTRVNSGALEDIRGNLSVIFSEDMDMGGYFTPSEEKATEEASTEQETVTENVCAEQMPEAVEMELSVSETSAVMPVIGTVTSDYGTREHPVYSGESFHSGRDIAAEEGTEIYAVLSGTVTEAGTAEMAGKYIKLQHADGTQTLYCHCSELLVKAGDTVNKGDTIALVGQTGLATGPHLHFEYHKDGKAADPEEILAGAVNVR